MKFKTIFKRFNVILDWKMVLFAFCIFLFEWICYFWIVKKIYFLLICDVIFVDNYLRLWSNTCFSTESLPSERRQGGNEPLSSQRKSFSGSPQYCLYHWKVSGWSEMRRMARGNFLFSLFFFNSEFKKNCLIINYFVLQNRWKSLSLRLVQ